MAKQPISIRVTSSQVYSELARLEQAGVTDNIMRTVALRLMPQGVKWFESGADWSFAFWLIRLVNTAKSRGNHVAATYTFQTGKAKF